MNNVSLTISPETPDDALAIERLHERTFGPGRYAKTAYRIREGVSHDPALSFTARIGTLLVGSVRLTPIRIGETKALLLGPLTIEPPFRDRGIGQKLIERALEDAKDAGPQACRAGRRRAVLPACGFKRIPKGQVTMPGPVDPARLLVAELSDGAFGVTASAGLGIAIREPARAHARSALTRPSRAQVAARTPISSNSPSRPANTGSTPMPRTTLASRIFRPIQSSPL